MIFEPCHKPAADALCAPVALLVDVCASAGAAINAEPRTAAARNFESIFFLLRWLLRAGLTRMRRNGSGARREKVANAARLREGAATLRGCGDPPFAHAGSIAGTGRCAFAPGIAYSPNGSMAGWQ